MTSLERTVQRLVDLEDIRSLTASYAHAVDKGLQGKGVDFAALPGLFTADATWNATGMAQPVAGIDNIVTSLRAGTAQIDFAMHSFSNPVITIDGDTAHAKWLLWVGIKTGDTANMVLQGETLTYARTADGWRISTLDLQFGTMLVG